MRNLSIQQQMTLEEILKRRKQELETELRYGGYAENYIASLPDLIKEVEELIQAIKQ